MNGTQLVVCAMTIIQQEHKCSKERQHKRYLKILSKSGQLQIFGKNGNISGLDSGRS